jgi:endo-1,4-beta-xylanase
MRSTGRRSALRLLAGAFAAGLAAAPAGALTLREAAAIAGIHVGVATGPVELATGLDTLVAAEFDSVTPENDMKWSELSPAPGSYDFTRADALVAFAEANAMRVRGHTLVWGRPNGPPGWLDATLAAAPDPAATLHDLMLDHIATVAGRYAGRIDAWEVMNEPLAFSTGSLDPANFYYQWLGPAFIADALRAAHAADPTARLFLNEVAAENNPAKFAGLLALVGDLLADGVGLPRHHGLGRDRRRHLARLVPHPRDLRAEPAAALRRGGQSQAGA